MFLTSSESILESDEELVDDKDWEAADDVDMLRARPDLETHPPVESDES